MSVYQMIYRRIHPTLFVGLFSLVGSVACVSSEEQLEVDGELAAEVADPDVSGAGGSGEAPQLTTAQAFGEKKQEKIPPPIDKETEGAVLPLPEAATYFAVRGFLEEYRDAYLKFMPLGSEYRLFFAAIASEGGSEGEGREAMEARVRESFEKSHWVFVYGVQELMEYLAGATTGTLMIDREENFVARMKTISFLGGILSEVAGDEKYRAFARNVYISLSKKHFGRTVKKREGK